MQQDITWTWHRQHRTRYYAMQQHFAGSSYPAIGLVDDFGNLIVVG